MVDQENRITLEEVPRVTEIQGPIDDEQHCKKSNDSDAPLPFDHLLTGRANATIETPKGKLIFRNTFLSRASSDINAALIEFGKT